LFAPHWRSDARGVIAGLTGYINKGHLARAVLEATAWQTREVLDAMIADAGLAVGFWTDTDALRANWHAAARWRPNMDPAQRERGYRKWRRAVERTLDWVDEDDD
jgi:glycerol kinase